MAVFANRSEAGSLRRSPVMTPAQEHSRGSVGGVAPASFAPSCLTPIVPPAGVSQVTLATRKSVLDLVAADTKALQLKLGANDRRRLDQHLQGVTELEKQLVGSGVLPAGCSMPTRPTSAFAAIDAEQIQWEPLNAAQTDLLVFALACDQTRVFTHRFSPCR